MNAVTIQKAGPAPDPDDHSIIPFSGTQMLEAESKQIMRRLSKIETERYELLYRWFAGRGWVSLRNADGKPYRGWKVALRDQIPHYSEYSDQHLSNLAYEAAGKFRLIQVTDQEDSPDSLKRIILDLPEYFFRDTKKFSPLEFKAALLLAQATAAVENPKDPTLKPQHIQAAIQAIKDEKETGGNWLDGEHVVSPARIQTLIQSSEILQEIIDKARQKRKGKGNQSRFIATATALVREQRPEGMLIAFDRPGGKFPINENLKGKRIRLSISIDEPKS